MNIQVKQLSCKRFCRQKKTLVQFRELLTWHIWKLPPAEPSRADEKYLKNAAKKATKISQLQKLQQRPAPVKNHHDCSIPLWICQKSTQIIIITWYSYQIPFTADHKQFFLNFFYHFSWKYSTNQ